VPIQCGPSHVGTSLSLLRVWTLLLLATAVIAARALAQTPDDGRLSAGQRQIADLKSTRHDITISAQLDRPDATYRIGDGLELTLTASEDVFVTVLNVGSSGRVIVLVPNAHEKVVRSPTGTAITIPARHAPYAIRVGGPPGFELIRIIATKEPIDLFAGQAHQPGGIFRSLDKPAVDLARGLSADLGRQAKHGYVVADLVIRVIGSVPSPR